MTHRKTDDWTLCRNPQDHELSDAQPGYCREKECRRENRPIINRGHYRDGRSYIGSNSPVGMAAVVTSIAMGGTSVVVSLIKEKGKTARETIRQTAMTERARINRGSGQTEAEVSAEEEDTA
ncbi:hypothetical protein [Streptomyces sp. NPDC021622]|uniref:hypothetical protein n=1 Tax=Streptomyces sp. NPDC021622 TaxID=3155013 RepID=UPI0033F67380